MDVGDIATAYAAAVATIVGGVQIWQHFRSGARLRVRVAPSVSVIGGDKLDQDMICVTVTNIGTAPTTITGLSVVPTSRRFGRKRPDGGSAYYIPNPQLAHYPAIVPTALNPGEEWKGFIRVRDDGPNFRNGAFRVSIASTMHAKGVEARIPEDTT